ncbi:MAG: hypothetical protein AAFV95_01165 [Bacteroidota bacterium]
MDPKEYRPIACGFYDELLLLAQRQTACLLQYTDADGQKQEHRSHIADVYSREGAEYLRLDSGEEIRLDRVLSAQPDS